MTPALAKAIEDRARKYHKSQGLGFYERTKSGVYFVRWGAYIKIGCAWDVVSRRRAIENGIPEGDVEPLGFIRVPTGTMYGHHGHEARIHDLLHKYRVRGEWFRDCPTIRRFIARYCVPWPEVK
jgi:hypothetical protein